MNNLTNKLLGIIEGYIAKKWLNISKTIYINFRLLPFHHAIKLPIYIYGPVTFNSLAGKVEIQSKSIFTGMIKLGIQQGCFTACKRGAAILITKNAKIIFHGPCSFDYDYIIRVTNYGTLEIGAFSGFGSDIKLCCNYHISIGDYCRVAFGTVFMDTNYHYTINTDTNTVYRKDASIHIGNFNWIGNSCSIMKGTKTADHTIIGSKSFLNKDYTKDLVPGESVVIAGSPATITGKNMRRIFNVVCEDNLDRRFTQLSGNKCTVDDLFAQQCLDMETYTRIFN